MIYPPNPRYVGVAPSLNNIYTSVAAQFHQAQVSANNNSSTSSSSSGNNTGSGPSSSNSGNSGSTYQHHQQTQLHNNTSHNNQHQQQGNNNNNNNHHNHAHSNNNQLDDQHEIPVQLIQPRLPYHFPQQYYPDTKIENPMFIESTTIAPLPNQILPNLSTAGGNNGNNNGGCTRSCCVNATAAHNNSTESKKGGSGNNGGSTAGFGSVSSTGGASGSSSSDNNGRNGNGKFNKGNVGSTGSSIIGAKRTMSSSSSSSTTTDQLNRMAPRPAKSPAWSFPPMMSIPSPIQDDPSSCSDNASDHSDKLESVTSVNSRSHHNSGHHIQQQQHESNSNSNSGNHQKNRKRKITNAGYNGGNGNDHIKDATTSSNSNAQASLWADAESLAADFDGSLSGLGADLSSSSYDMSEALLSLPTIYNHSRGLANTNANASSSANSSSHNNNNANSSSSSGNVNSASSSGSAQHNSSSGTNNGGNGGAGSGNTNTSNSGGVGAGGNSSTGSLRESGLTPLAAQHHHGGSTASLPGDFHYENKLDLVNNRNSPSFGAGAGAGGHSSSSTSNNNQANSLDCERRFQYVLAAATSIATKVNEETITYLNQGQPYEIKLKKLGELTAYRGTVFKTVVRLCFHDRRLQFSEREQIALWEYSHPRDRILQVDLPLSYGIAMLTPAADMSTNAVSFLWEPLKEVGLYVKVNCISTEFTPKKHGGEKGVPFRLMIETYSHPENVRLHASACQVKVFKLKGADRKHKQDREKIMKKTPSEQAKLQPSYECTVLSDISLESLDSSPPPSIQNQIGGQSSGVISPTSFALDFANGGGGAGGESPDDVGGSGGVYGNNGIGGAGAAAAILDGPNGSGGANATHFSAHFSSESVRRWLVRNRFSSSKTLWDFSGLDLLRLSKDELIEICGLAEGIRLYNALHYKITFFVTLASPNRNNSARNQPMLITSDLDENISSENSEDETTFHPICLSSPSTNELVAVLNSLLNPSNSYSQQIERVFLSVNPSNNSNSNGNGSTGNSSNASNSNGSSSNSSTGTTAGGLAGRRIHVLLNEQLLSTLKDQSAFKMFKIGNDVALQLLE